MSMKIVGYVRVSTDRQAERGLGLDVQRQRIKQWAKAQGHQIVAVHEDAGVSASNGLADRVGLADALDLVGQGKAQGIVVARLDRLARDYLVQEFTLREVHRLGGEVFSTEEQEAGILNDDPDVPSRKFIRTILGGLGDYERELIALRLRSGRRRKHERGGYAYGAPPYGYRSEDGDLVPVDDEQATIARIRELHSTGHSLRSIAAVLSAESRRPKRGDRWHPATLAKIIARL